MALSVQLASRGRNRLRYLVIYDGTVGTGVTANIPSTGGATPDLATDSQGLGAIEKLANVVRDGYGQFAPGPQSADESIALWASNWVFAAPGPDKSILPLPTAICRTQLQSCAGAALAHLGVVPTIDGGGNPRLTLTVYGAGVSACDWYLDVEVPGAIGA